MWPLEMGHASVPTHRVALGELSAAFVGGVPMLENMRDASRERARMRTICAMDMPRTCAGRCDERFRAGTVRTQRRCFYPLCLTRAHKHESWSRAAVAPFPACCSPMCRGVGLPAQGGVCCRDWCEGRMCDLSVMLMASAR